MSCPWVSQGQAGGGSHSSRGKSGPLDHFASPYYHRPSPAKSLRLAEVKSLVVLSEEIKHMLTYYPRKGTHDRPKASLVVQEYWRGMTQEEQK